jgi:sugar phosphate isomerase/epimerase
MTGRRFAGGRADVRGGRSTPDRAETNRRAFVRQSAAVIAASAVSGVDLALAADCSIPPAAVQLWTVRDALREDPRNTVESLRRIGVVEAEMFGLSGGDDARPHGMRAPDLKRLLDDNGLRVPFAQIGGDLTNVPATAELAHELGTEVVIVAMPDEFGSTRDGRFTRVPPRSRAQLDRLAERLNAAGREYRSLGLAFGYHNHDVDFVPVEGVVSFDYLMERTEPAVVGLELDVGWLAVAGMNPVDYLRRYAGRVLACHMKDYDAAIKADIPDRKLVEPGAGTVDFGAVLTAMAEAKVAHAFIEIDDSDDPFGAVERGLAHLRLVGACA